MFFGNDTKMSFGIDGDTFDEHLIEIPFLFRHINPPARAIDIGCTGSPVALQLAAMRYNLVGIDYREYGYKNANLRFIKGDFASHNFGKERFDIVIAMNSIEHFGLKYYSKSEYFDKQADIKAMTKVKELINKGGQLIFSAKYGISDLITQSGKPFMRVYDDKALDVLLSTFDVKNIEYYMISADKKNIRQVANEEAAGSRYYQSGTYGFVCVNAIKQ